MGHGPDHRRVVLDNQAGNRNHYEKELDQAIRSYLEARDRRS
jgi:hypothetical protein